MRKSNGMVLTIAIAASLCSTWGADFYVAPMGKDTNPGTLGEPFLTVSKAAAVARAGDTVFLRAGTYRETVMPTHSGEQNRPIVFCAYRDEVVTVSGVDPVTGWTLHTNRIYRAPMNWDLGIGRNQVFVDGQYATPARHPNKDNNKNGYILPRRYVRLGPMWPVLGDFTVTERNVTSSTNLDQPKDHWKGAIYMGNHFEGWSWQSGVVCGSSPGRLELTNTTARWWFDVKTFGTGHRENQQGFLSYHMHALDEPGEWHWQDNTLYLWAPDGNSPQSQRVEAKRRQLAFDLRGRNYIHIRNLSIFGASVTMDGEGCVIEKVKASYVSHFTWFNDAREGYIDDPGKRTANSPPQRGEVGFYLGGTNHVVRDCAIGPSAGAALFVTGLRCMIFNNVFVDCGYTPTYMSGLVVTYDPSKPFEAERGGHTIVFNTFRNMGRGAITVQSDETGMHLKANETKKKQMTKDSNTQFRPMEISYNRFCNGMIAANDGSGGFYDWCCSFDEGDKRTQLHHNLFWDRWGLHGWSSHIYPDNSTFGLDVHHNLIWNRPEVPKNKFGDFYGRNDPNDTKIWADVTKTGYTAGPDDLLPSDYPEGGFFYSGTDHDEELRPIARSVATAPLPTDGWTATGSDSWKDDVPGRALDGNPVTRWTTGRPQTPGHWFAVDMAKPNKFNKIALNGYTSIGGHPRGYDIFVSDNGKDWGQPVARGTSSGDSPRTSIGLPEQTKQWFKIVLTKESPGDWWSIHDLSVFLAPEPRLVKNAELARQLGLLGER